MPRYVKHILSNWGNFPREEVCEFRPDSPPEIDEILRERSVPSYIARGLGRSYGDASLNAGAGVISEYRLNRFLDWDANTGIVECEAGVTFEDLLDVFLPRGFFPPVTPGTKFVTMGGAIAADVHGKNHHRDGSIANFIASFDLLTADGDVRRCSPNENADVFWATVGGMGLTGIVLAFRLKLVPVETAFINVRYQRAPNLDAALEGFEKDQSAHYSVAWIDCLARGASLGRSVLMTGEHAKAGDLPPAQRESPLVKRTRRKRSVPFMFPGFALNSFNVRLFNKLYYMRHGDGERLVDYDAFFYPLDSVLHWNRIYGKRGFVQYQIVIPHASSRTALVQILEKLAQARMASFLAVLKTFGPANNGLLSFPMPGATLALDIPHRGEAMLRLLNELDQIVLQHGGRVYLAKDARISRDAFEAMYPHVQQFRKMKALLDPEGLFSSSLARRLALA